MRWMFATALLALSTTAGLAQDHETSTYFIMRDAFLAGQAVTHDAPEKDDLFMAGERITSAAPISGTAHLAGRWIAVEAAVGQDVYAAGQEIEIAAEVAGDATLAAQEIDLAAPISGDLRVTGSALRLQGTVGGYAMIAGEDVRFDAVVAGDVALAGREIDFGRTARIEGTLTLYEDEPGRAEVPDRVIPAERIVRRQIEDWDSDFGDIRVFSWRRAIGSFLTGIIVVAGLAALIAALAPHTMAEMRRRVLESPVRTTVFGFLTLSALTGSSIILGLTVIGLLLSPAAIFLALLTGFLGYVIGAYALGVGLLSALGNALPDSTGDRALAAAVGAVTAGLIALIPILGWLAMLALVMAGAGAIVIRMMRPGFFTSF